MGDKKERLDVEDMTLEVIRRLIHEKVLPVVVHLERDDEALLRAIRTMLDERMEVGRCRFSDEGAGTVLRALTGGDLTGRAAPLRDLRVWLKGARRVVVADPYFMHGDPTSWGWTDLTDAEKKSKAEAYAEEVRQILGDVEHLDVFHLPGPPKALQTAMKKIAFVGRKSVKTIPTTEIHDRVWIKDGEDARIIGTSFGGIGRKLAFMLSLPAEDRDAFRKELDRIRGA